MKTAIDRLLITWKSDFSNKKKILPSCDCISSTVGMHHMDINETHGEKARGELHKNATCSLEQVLEAEPNKQQLYGCLPPTSQAIQVR